MTLYNQIQELMIKCIGRVITVKAFREQFVPVFFALNRQFDIDAVVLADNVDNLYADLLIGEITEDEFRQKLIQLTPIVMTEEEKDVPPSKPNWISKEFPLEQPLQFTSCV